MLIMDTTLYFGPTTEESFEPSSNAPQPERDFNIQWDFEPWDQPKREPLVAQPSIDWMVWKPFPGAVIVYEKDRFGRLVKPRVCATFV